MRGPDKGSSTVHVDVSWYDFSIVVVVVIVVDCLGSPAGTGNI